MSNSMPQVARELLDAGIRSFPCVVYYDNAKRRWAKHPITVEGEHWAKTAQRAPDDPAVTWRGVEVVGVPIPDGIVVLDLDSYKPGAATLESLGVTPAQAHQALIQTTIGGGKHYAFRAPEWEVKQGSNHGSTAIDTRVAGKGFICTGNGYTSKGIGVAGFAWPAALPILPETLRPLLARVITETAPQVSPSEVTDHDEKTIIAALQYVDPGVDREHWLRIGMALRNHYAEKPDRGLEIWETWSHGGYDVATQLCPENYVPNETTKQWNAIRPSGRDGTPVTISTLFYQAIHAGWKPPASFNVASAFGADAAPIDIYQALATRIIEQGADIAQTPDIVQSIREAGCNDLQSRLLLGALKAELKSAKILDASTTRLLDAAVPTVKAPQVSKQIPQLCEIDTLEVDPIHDATGSHGLNASIMQEYVFAKRLACDEGVLRWWSGRAWVRIPENTLQRITWQALFPGQAKLQVVNGTIAALKATAPPLSIAARGPRVFFEDQLIDVQANQAYAHHPDNANRSCLTVPFQAESNAPEWHKFLQTIFGNSADGDDRIALLQEIMGWAMLETDLNVQKIIAFDGASRAGKGVALEVLQAILGRQRCGTFTFGELDDGKMQSVLRHHDVVVDFEAKPPTRQGLKAATSFMNKVASNEEVSIKLLHTQSPWTGRLNCKMILACNGVPAMIDDSGATTARFQVLHFNRSFIGREDRGLLARLLEELPGIARWALDGAQRLVANDGVFTQPESSNNAKDDLRAANEPLQEFINERLEVRDGHKVHITDLWVAYRQFAADNNIKLGTKRAFAQSLKQTLLAVEGVTHNRGLRIDGIQSTGFEGLAVRGVQTMAATAFQPKVVN